MFHTESVGMFAIFLHTTFHMPNYGCNYHRQTENVNTDFCLSPCCFMLYRYK